MSNPENAPAETAAAPVPAAPVAPAPAATAPAAGLVAVGADSHITIDDFMKVELRVAKVLEAEAVPKSKKLLKLSVDAGSETRTILAGIAEAYTPEQMVGRTIVIVANLAPRKLMGIESNGMVLAASVGDGLPVLVTVDNVPGARVR
jgi:methionyl-tRNA synthetase